MMSSKRKERGKPLSFSFQPFNQLLAMSLSVKNDLIKWWGLFFLPATGVVRMRFLRQSLFC
jgi:hypothetical protein